MDYRIDNEYMVPDIFPLSSSNIGKIFKIISFREEQPGAELCQAQAKLGWAKIYLFFFSLEIKVIFDLK